VYLLVTGKHGLLHSGPASWIQSTQAEEIACVGRFSVSPEEEIHGVLFVVFGTKSEVRSVFRSLSTSEIAPASYLSIDELRERLVERRSMLRQLDGEVRLQEERIETLQEDADAIANVAKIVNIEDELEDVKRKIQALDMAAKDIQQRKSQMKSRPAPLNAQTREAELVKQLAELSTALSATETSALQRISSASGELQGKLQLIEDTRDDHVTLLEEELAELQRRRKR
jgi:vacuolar-type H+-ATPase subunit I/STV1